MSRQPMGTDPDSAGKAVPRFLYVADPMCAWCWGFAPVLESVRQHNDLPVDVLVGGLRPGPEARLLDDDLRDYLRNEWERAHRLTRQVFNTAGLEREMWTYDTELPAMAVTTMRSLNEPATLPFFSRLQRAFYAEGRDITDPDAYSDLLKGYAVDADAFLEAMVSDIAKQAAWQDFTTARRIGITSFPTLLMTTDGQRLRLITNGYQSAERLAPIIDSALAGLRPQD